MKKNQSGVSLISLVITIIVVIILAAVAFSSSTDTITNANFSNFTNNVGEVRTSFQTVATTIKGQEAQNQITRTDAQVYNFVAKGASLFDKDTESGDRMDSWLSRSQANTLACTQLSGDAMKDVIDMKLPTVKVNTDLATGVAVSYFVTREGTVFVWPPYEYENEYYVTDTIKVTKSGDTETVKADDSNPNTKVADMYKKDFSFMVGNVEIKTDLYDGDKALEEGTADYSTLATVFYTDGIGAKSPVGRESATLFDSGASEAGN